MSSLWSLYNPYRIAKVNLLAPLKRWASKTVLEFGGSCFPFKMNTRTLFYSFRHIYDNMKVFDCFSLVSEGREQTGSEIFRAGAWGFVEAERLGFRLSAQDGGGGGYGSAVGVV